MHRKFGKQFQLKCMPFNQLKKKDCKLFLLGSQTRILQILTLASYVNYTSCYLLIISYSLSTTLLLTVHFIIFLKLPLL
jgi:hypothetical protein